MHIWHDSHHQINVQKGNRFEEIQKQLSLAHEKIDQLTEHTNHLTEQNESLRADIICLRDQQSSPNPPIGSPTLGDGSGKAAAVPQGASGGNQWPTLQTSHGAPASTSASAVPTKKCTLALQRKQEKTPATGNATEANPIGREERRTS